MSILSDDIIKEVAETIDLGQRVYLNRETFEHFSLPPDEYMDDMEELYKEDLAKLEAEPENYIEFLPLVSREGFKIMEDFIDLMEDGAVKDQLVDALEKRKPFYNFRWVLNNNPDVRTRFDEFKLQKIMDTVKTIIYSQEA